MLICFYPKSSNKTQLFNAFPSLWSYADPIQCYECDAALADEQWCNELSAENVRLEHDNSTVECRTACVKLVSKPTESAHIVWCQKRNFEQVLLSRASYISAQSDT